MLVAALLASTLERPEILAVRCEPAGSGRVLVRLLAAAELQGVTTEHHGDDFVVTIPALVAEGLALPRPAPPLRSLAFEAGGGEARLRLGGSPGARLEARAEGSLLTLVVEAGDPQATRDIDRLYPLLFPRRLEQEPPPPADAPREDETRRTLSLRPALMLRYIDGDGTYLGSPTPVRVRYLEVQPSLTLSAGPAASEARLTVRYEPRLRTQHSVPVLKDPSHFLSAQLELPLGQSLRLTAADDWARGAIEAEVLDPGREYFYDLGSFRRNQVSLRLRKETPGRLDWEMGGISATEFVAPGTAYFDNKRQQFFVGPFYELGPTLKAGLRYEYERVLPPVTRPVVEARSHAILGSLEGDLSQSIKANLNVGFREERHPRAVPGADSFSGFVFGLSLRRTFLNGGSLSLGGSRTPQLSAFEANAFYGTNGVQAQFVTPLPLGVLLSLGAGYQRNDYRLDATGLDEPRRDDLFGWTAGLARPLTSWSFLRADYYRDRRDSNVPGLSTRTHSFVVQLGLSGAVKTGR